ncbi:heme biosynthesis protein HemY [Jatrophihabitans sp. DSM 45814]
MTKHDPKHDPKRDPKRDRPVPPAEQDPQRFKHLPEHVDPKDLVTSQETEPARDPEGGRDTDRDFMIRYAAGD